QRVVGSVRDLGSVFGVIAAVVIGDLGGEPLELRRGVVLGQLLDGDGCGAHRADFPARTRPLPRADRSSVAPASPPATVSPVGPTMPARTPALQSGEAS